MNKRGTDNYVKPAVAEGVSKRDRHTFQEPEANLEVEQHPLQEALTRHCSGKKGRDGSG